MVRKFVAGMTRMPVVLILCLALVAVGIVLLLQPQPARAGVVYASPFWTVTAGVQEKACQTCGCEMPSAIVEPGVSVLTEELVLSIPITSSPTMLGAARVDLAGGSALK